MCDHMHCSPLRFTVTQGWCSRKRLQSALNVSQSDLGQWGWANLTITQTQTHCTWLLWENICMSSSLIAQTALAQSNRSFSALHLCQISIRSRGHVWAFSRDGLTLLFLDQIWRMMTMVISSMMTWTQTSDLTWVFMISDLCLRCCPVTFKKKIFATLRHFSCSYAAQADLTCAVQSGALT